MRKYHSLRVAAVVEETPDAVRIDLEVPAEAQEAFRFLPGQHLPLQITIDGEPVRRTYSICSAPGRMPLQLGIRVQPGGRFSSFVAGRIAAGDSIEAMPPFGRFHADIDPENDKTVLAFAAGSGITPILSIVTAILEGEPASRVLLFYGNRRQQTTMFIDDLHALKDRFPERLQLFFVFSQEEQEFDLCGGRLDSEKVKSLYTAFCRQLSPDEAFVCGPDTMIDEVRSALLDAGMAEERIHAERFGAPRGNAPARIAASPTDDTRQATIDVIMDGHRKSFRMPLGEGNIVDAAAAAGLDLPYSCKGGVCATCRTHVRDGTVRMATNYGLEPWEVEAGFVLACQSTPTTDTVTIDYDKT